MRRDFKQALHGLKDTYPSPDPKRMEEFLRTLPAQEEEQEHVLLPLFHVGSRPLRFAIPAVVTAVLMLTVGIGVYKKYQPHVIDTLPPVETTTTTAATFGTTTYTETVTQAQETTGHTESGAASETAPSTTETAQTSASAASQTTPGLTLPAVTPTGTTAASAVTSAGTLFPVQTTASHPAETSPVNEVKPADDFTETTRRTTAVTEQEESPEVDPVPEETTVFPQETTAWFTTTTARYTTTARHTTTTRYTTTTACYTTTARYTTTTACYTTEAATQCCETTADRTEAPTESCCDTPVLEPTEPSYPAEDAAPYTRSTVTVTYQPTDTILEWRDFFDPSTDLESSDVWWHTDAYSASDIVIGTVTGIRWTAIQGVPYTAIDVEVSETLRGYHSGGSLTIFERGGYAPLSVLRDQFTFAVERTSNYTEQQIADTTVYEVANYAAKAAVGDTCLFMISEDDHSGVRGYFYPSTSTRCRLKYNGSKYVTPDGARSVAYSELYNWLH